MDIPVEAYLRSTTATAAALSPDGLQLAYLANVTGVMQAFVVPVDASAAPRQVTDGGDRVSALTWSPTDPALLLFARDAGGNENHQLFTLDLADARVTALTDAPAAMHVLGGWSRDGRLVAYATNRANGTDFDVVVRELATGRERIVWDRGGYCQAGGFSPGRRWVAVMRANSNVDSDVYLLDLRGSESPAWWESLDPLPVLHGSPHTGRADFGAPRWVDESSYLYVGDHESNVATLRRHDLTTGRSTEVLASDWDVESVAVGWDARSVAVVVNADGYSRVSLFDLDADAALIPRPDAELPRGQLSGLIWSHDGRRLALTAAGPTRASNAWVWHADTGLATQCSDATLGVSEQSLVEPDLLRLSSFDGLTVPFFRYQPTGDGTADRPVVITIHGGPEGQSRPVFDPLGQYLVSRGYVVLAPNVRGSTGYGKAYQALDDIGLRLDSVADLAALHDWITDAPGLDRNRVALYGGSYGGYMVLAGLAFYPDRWAAGVDVVGIANLETFLENTSSYRRAMRECEYGYLDRDRAILRAASPIHRIDDVLAPLLIIHGANDPRVPLSEAEQVRDALEARGVTTELLVYGDEGHGLVKLVNRLDAYPRVAAFLDRFLSAPGGSL